MAASYQCSFGGYPLVYPTQKIKKWIDKNVDLSQIKLTIPARSWPGAATDITYPLNENTTSPGLYKLYYPSSGVSRWGEMWGLVSGTNLGQMIARQKDDLILQCSSATEDRINFEDWILAAAIPLAEFGNGSGGSDTGRIDSVTNEPETLHLVLFVDERFFYANYSASSTLDLGCANDWNGVVTDLLSDIGISASVPAISTSYGVPSNYSDLIESGQYNAAVMLDAVMLNIGCKLVRVPNATYVIKTYSTCNTVEKSVDLSDYTLRSGGDWSRNERSFYLSTLPQDCKFYFPIWDVDEGAWEAPDESTEFHLRSPLNSAYYYEHTITKSAAFTANGLDNPTSYNASNSSKVFRMTARAFGSSPTNLSAISAMATQYAADFYNRKYWSLRHETWNKIVAPSGSGWFDYVYYFCDDVYTKVIGEAANHDVEQLMPELCEDISSESSSSSSISSESSSSLCYNPFRGLQVISNPTYVLGMDEDECLGWVLVEGCDSSSAAP